MALVCDAHELDYNEEQPSSPPRSSASSTRITPSRRVKIVASNEGYSDAIWSTLPRSACSPAVPAGFGGFGGGAVDLMTSWRRSARRSSSSRICRRSAWERNSCQGRHECPATGAIALVGAGKLKMALAQPNGRALQSRARCDAGQADERRYALSGEKRIVVHALCADQLIVSARTAGATPIQPASVSSSSMRGARVSMNAYAPSRIARG